MDRQPVEGKANTSPTRSAEPITSTGSQSLCAPPCLEFGRGFDCVNGNRTDGRLEHMSWTNLKAKTRKASGSNIMIPQCSALIRTFPQLHYRRGLKPVATPPPFNKNATRKGGFFIKYWCREANPQGSRSKHSLRRTAKGWSRALARDELAQRQCASEQSRRLHQ